MVIAQAHKERRHARHLLYSPTCALIRQAPALQIILLTLHHAQVKRFNHHIGFRK